MDVAAAKRDMFIKQRILETLTKHPKALTFGIGLSAAAIFAAFVFVAPAQYTPVVA